MYRFPAIHVRTSFCATVSAMAKFKPGCLYLFQTYSSGGATIGSPICAGTLYQCTFSGLKLVVNIVGEPKRTAAASRGFLATARLFIIILSLLHFELNCVRSWCKIRHLACCRSTLRNLNVQMYKYIEYWTSNFQVAVRISLRAICTQA